MPYLETTGAAATSIFYQDVGHGRPVVLIHCWPLSQRVWERQVDALVDAGFRVVAYDRRGFGASDKPADGYDYDTLASDLRDLILALDLRDAVLVGYSMGGGEVARYVGRYGADRVSAAVLVAAAPPFMLRTEDNPDGIPEGVLDGLVAAVRRDRLGFLGGFFEAFFGLADDPTAVSADVLQYYKSIAWAASPLAMQRCIPAFGKTDFRADLARMDVPTLIVHGDADQNVPAELTSRRSAAIIPNAHLEIVPSAPHGIAVTHPEQLNRLLLAFLRS
jgi:non-heme chloroperoxidase